MADILTDNTEKEKLADLLSVDATVHDIGVSTRRAISTIMDTCDTLLPTLPPAQQDILRRIYEACAVQDLTEQRLKRITRLVQRLRGADVPPNDPLMEGPARDGGGLSQDDIDRMLGNT